MVVPNARFAETIITNYYEPDPPVNVYLTCGVSYNSDLARVEAVSMDVMNGVLDTSPHGVKEYGAYFGFDNFGESNVDFWLFVQARDRLASFELRSALIHELHRRFDEEGIVINYPVRSIQFPNGASPPPDGRPGVPAPTFVRRPPPADTPNVDSVGEMVLTVLHSGRPRIVAPGHDGKVARHEFLVRSVGRPGTSHQRRKPGPNSASRASVICYLRFQGAVFCSMSASTSARQRASRSSRAFFSCPRLRASSMACWRRARISSSISRCPRPGQAGWRTFRADGSLRSCRHLWR